MLAAIIMAGGSGERFWPLSTPEKPKQLLKIFSDKSMIRETVDRILPIIHADNIFVATNIIQSEEIKKELFDIPEENIIIEPLFKDTAAAIGFSSLIIKNRLAGKLKANEKIEIVVLASDHIIEREVDFRKVILIGSEEANRNATIVTLGIKPSKPETGYGYIEIDQSNFQLNSIYNISQFREKPNRETAEKYLSSGRYLWNSGMFIFSIDTIFKNFGMYMKKHSDIFEKIEEKIIEEKDLKQLSKNTKELFEEFEKISIDFGIMEHSKDVRVVPIDIGWNDIGSFNAFDEIFDGDENGNILSGKNIKTLYSKDNIVVSDDLNISLLGVENLVIVKNGDNLLISSKDKTQEIKKILK